MPAFEGDGTTSPRLWKREIKRLTAERDEARACLVDAMRLIQETAQVHDVDIDHDEVWPRWVRAAGLQPAERVQQ